MVVFGEDESEMISIADPVKKQSALVGFLHSVLSANLQLPSFVLDPISFGSVGSLGGKTSHTCETDLDLTLEK